MEGVPLLGKLASRKMSSRISLNWFRRTRCRYQLTYDWPRGPRRGFVAAGLVVDRTSGYRGVGLIFVGTTCARSSLTNEYAQTFDYSAQNTSRVVIFNGRRLEEVR